MDPITLTAELIQAGTNDDGTTTLTFLVDPELLRRNEKPLPLYVLSEITITPKQPN